MENKKEKEKMKEGKKMKGRRGNKRDPWWGEYEEN